MRRRPAIDLSPFGTISDFLVHSPRFPAVAVDERQEEAGVASHQPPGGGKVQEDKRQLQVCVCGQTKRSNMPYSHDASHKGDQHLPTTFTWLCTSPTMFAGSMLTASWPDAGPCSWMQAFLVATRLRPFHPTQRAPQPPGPDVSAVLRANEQVSGPTDLLQGGKEKRPPSLLLSTSSVRRWTSTGLHARTCLQEMRSLSPTGKSREQQAGGGYASKSAASQQPPSSPGALT